MMFFTADLHFGHEGIISSCKRPFKNASHMDKELIRNWNQKVAPNDTVVIAGDFPLSKVPDVVERYANKLSGKKILILGNHDYLKPLEYINRGFQSVHTSCGFFAPKGISNDLKDLLNNITIVHDPAESQLDRKNWWICGHIHDLFRVLKNCINVGVDVWEYFPVPESTIINIVRTHNPDIHFIG